MRLRACLAALALLAFLGEHALVAAHLHAHAQKSGCCCHGHDHGDPGFAPGDAHEDDSGDCAICQLAPRVPIAVLDSVALPPAGSAPRIACAAHHDPSLLLELRLPPPRGPPNASRLA